MPLRYWFLHEPSPTRNTKAIRGFITTAPTSDVKDIVVDTAAESPAILVEGGPKRRKAQTENEGAATDTEANAQVFKSRRSALQAARKSNIVALPEQPAGAHAGRVHILGTHELGKLAAHSLASLKNRPPITLLLHSEEMMRRWGAEGETIVLVKDNKVDARVGFDIERQGITKDQHAQTALLGNTNSDNPWFIKQLIVADYGFHTLPALFNLRDRLNVDSTILFLHDSEGIIDRVNEKIFQNPAARPQYIRAHSTHGITNHPIRTFAIKHHRVGSILLSHSGGMAMADLKTKHPSTSDLIDTLQKSHALRAIPKPMHVLLYHKLQRLAIDSVIGTLSVVLDCQILDLRFNYMVSQNLREMLTEICAVCRKMPELQELKPNAWKKFTVDYLEKSVAETCNQMQQVIVHPMAQKVKLGQRTDIQFRNGFFVDQGEKLGVEMPVNLSMMRLVKAKQAMNQKRLEDWIPWHKGGPPK